MLELWVGACPEADVHGAAVYAEQFPLLNERVLAHISAVGEAAYLDECRAKALQGISNEPWRFARLCGLRAADYWLGTVFTHGGPGQGGWPRGRLRACVAIFLTLEVLVIAACLVIRPRLWGQVWWIMTMLAVFSIVYCLTHAQVRFRAPIEPLVAVVVSILFVETFETCWPPRHRQYHGNTS